MEYKQYAKDEYAADVLVSHYGRKPVAFVRSFGCQQSVNDGERLKGVLLDMGFELAMRPNHADVILYNTCAVREHAEQRMFGNLGALKSIKAKHPAVLIGVAGCMPQQKTTVEKIRASYPYVDFLLGTDAAEQLPGMLVEKLTTRKKALRVPKIKDHIVEQVPLRRESAVRAFVPIMYGCDNYCSYCVVPYVRGSEHSRRPSDVLAEFEGLVKDGYKDITLLGQNVNSYGKGLEDKLDFSDLLALLCQTPGEYRVRFMTSHPKDATRKMIDTMVENEHLCKHLHLPVQSGSNAILSKMNRKYTAEDYKNLIQYAKQRCPEMTFSTDIMVGFPGESEEDYQKTVALVEELGFTQIFTFIYSKRPGTGAAELPDDLPHAEKSGRINRLTELQEKKIEQLAQPWMDRQFKALVESTGRDEGKLCARLDNNMLVEITGEPERVGSFVDVEINGIKGAMLTGQLA